MIIVNPSWLGVARISLVFMERFGGGSAIEVSVVFLRKFWIFGYQKMGFKERVKEFESGCCVYYGETESKDRT